MAEQESALDFIEATHLWSQHAQFVGRAEGAPNPFRTIYGVEAQPGGVWDVMTRFHTICERLQLPFHVSTSVEVNPATGDSSPPRCRIRTVARATAPASGRSGRRHMRCAWRHCSRTSDSR